MPEDLRIAVIGVGRIGAMHAQMLARQTPGAKLLAVADALPESAKQVAEELQVEVAEIDELIHSSSIDAIAIATSTNTHADLIVKAARAGKAIFCEKPLCLDVKEVDRALAAVEAAGVPFMVGFNRRFDPGHKSVRDAVASSNVVDANLPYFFSDRYIPSFLNQWRAFVDYVQQGGESPVPGSAGRVSVVLGLAAWQSVREGRPIALAGI